MTRSFTICDRNEDRTEGACSILGGVGGEVHKGVWWRNPKERDNL